MQKYIYIYIYACVLLSPHANNASRLRNSPEHVCACVFVETLCPRVYAHSDMLTHTMSRYLFRALTRSAAHFSRYRHQHPASQKTLPRLSVRVCECLLFACSHPHLRCFDVDFLGRGTTTTRGNAGRRTLLFGQVNGACERVHASLTPCVRECLCLTRDDGFAEHLFECGACVCGVVLAMITVECESVAHVWGEGGGEPLYMHMECV